MEANALTESGFYTTDRNGDLDSINLTYVPIPDTPTCIGQEDISSIHPTNMEAFNVITLEPHDVPGAVLNKLSAVFM